MLDAPVITLRCASCGARLKTTEDFDRFACSYCGNEHIVSRSGGVVPLQPMVAELKQVQVGRDKTAAELVSQRLPREIQELGEQINQKLQEFYDVRSVKPRVHPLEKKRNQIPPNIRGVIRLHNKVVIPVGILAAIIAIIMNDGMGIGFYIFSTLVLLSIGYDVIVLPIAVLGALVLMAGKRDWKRTQQALAAFDHDLVQYESMLTAKEAEYNELRKRLAKLHLQRQENRRIVES